MFGWLQLGAMWGVLSWCQVRARAQGVTLHHAGGMLSIQEQHHCNHRKLPQGYTPAFFGTMSYAWLYFLGIFMQKQSEWQTKPKCKYQ